MQLTQILSSPDIILCPAEYMSTVHVAQVSQQCGSVDGWVVGIRGWLLGGLFVDPVNQVNSIKSFTSKMQVCIVSCLKLACGFICTSWMYVERMRNHITIVFSELSRSFQQTLIRICM